MSETLQQSTTETTTTETPSLLDAELDKSKASLRGRMARRIGRAISGEDQGFVITSSKEAALSRIKDAGNVTVEGSLDEARLQLEKVRKSRVNRMAKKTLGVLKGNKGYVTKKEATLTGIAGELQDELAPRPAELDQAYAMNTIRDAHTEEAKLHERETAARAHDREIKMDEDLLQATGSTLSGIDPQIVELRREQQDAHIDHLEKEKQENWKREGEAARAYTTAEHEQMVDEHQNPRPSRLRE